MPRTEYTHSALKLIQKKPRRFQLRSQMSDSTRTVQQEWTVLEYHHDMQLAFSGGFPIDDNTDLFLKTSTGFSDELVCTEGSHSALSRRES